MRLEGIQRVTIIIQLAHRSSRPKGSLTVSTKKFLYTFEFNFTNLWRWRLLRVLKHVWLESIWLAGTVRWHALVKRKVACISMMQHHMQSVQKPVVKCKACKPKAEHKIIIEDTQNNQTVIASQQETLQNTREQIESHCLMFGPRQD